MKPTETADQYQLRMLTQIMRDIRPTILVRARSPAG